MMPPHILLLGKGCVGEYECVYTVPARRDCILPRVHMHSRGKAMPSCLCVCVCVLIGKKNASSRVAKVFTDVIINENNQHN